MAQEKKSVSIPGVAEGKQLVGVTIDDGLSVEDKVNTFIAGAIGGDVYEVSAGFCCYNSSYYTIL
jgi:acyl-coenzyme A thioesterase 13